jgi:hypothetical protein
MAQDRNVEMIAALRAAAAETRAEISSTVNTIEHRLTTVVEAYLPDGQRGTMGSNVRGLTRNLASVTTARALARRLNGRANPTSWAVTMAILGAGIALWVWLKPARPTRGVI